MSAGGGKLKKEPSPATNLKLLPVWRVARRHIKRLLCSVVLIEGLLLSPFRLAQLFTQIGDLKYGGVWFVRTWPCVAERRDLLILLRLRIAYLGDVGRGCCSRMWRLCQRGNSLKRKKRKKEQTLHKCTRVLTSCSAGRWAVAAVRDTDASNLVTSSTASPPALGC